MKYQSLVLAVLLTMGTLVIAQEAPRPQPRKERPPVVQCEEMKKLMKAVQDHRATCNVCKTNVPPRGQFGPRDGRGPQGRGPSQR